MKRIAVIEKYYDCFKNYFKDVEVVLLTSNVNNCDLIVGDKSISNADICIHNSLLPAFDVETPIKDAYLAGVKVSGITIYTPNNKRIIAQYPVLIGNTTHYDEFKTEINKTGQLLYPIVVDKILKDEVFDFSDLIGGCHNGGCKKCGGCH